MARALKVPDANKGYTAELGQLVRIKSLVQMDRTRNQEKLLKIANQLTVVIQDFMSLNDTELDQRNKEHGRSK